MGTNSASEVTCGGCRTASELGAGRDGGIASPMVLAAGNGSRYDCATFATRCCPQK